MYCLSMNNEHDTTGIVAGAMKPKTPTLDALIALGTVWIEDCDYVGRASDGTVVSLGSVYDAGGTEGYLCEYSTPDTW